MLKDIQGYEGLYAVDDTGHVWALRSGQPRLMHPSRDKDGYAQVLLYDSEKNRHRFYVHRLVARAFILNPDELPQINHIDGNKSHNSVSNLEWCDAEHNNLHAHRAGLHPTDKLTINDARRIRAEYRKGVRGCGMRALAKKYGVSVGHICHVLQGKKLREVMPK